MVNEELPPSFDIDERADMLLSLLLGAWLRFAKGESSWDGTKIKRQVQLLTR